jgi:hypothetical protein
MRGYLALGLVGLAVTAAPASAATFSVTNTSDAGAGSLRQAITDANTLVNADTITISATGTVSLQSPLPDIAHDVTITGPGAGSFVVSRGVVTAFRIFTIDSSASVTISGLTVTGGDAGASKGGGVDNSGDLTLQSVVVTNNTSQDGGGGIDNLNGPLAIVDSTISGNTVAGGTGNYFGGGVMPRGAGPTTITGSTISGNSSTGAFSGGGGGIGVTSTGLVSVTNSTISGNSATDRGGGIGTFFGSNHLSVTSVTLAGNGGVGGGSVNGGNVYVEGAGTSAVTVINTIVASPVGSGVANCTGDGSFVSLGHNLESANTCQFSLASDINSVDPRLGPLADNGGPTQTRALLAGSLAIDAGTGAGLTTDQRGVARPQGAASDIGAFEYVAPAPAPPAPTPTPIPLPPVTPPPPGPILSPISSFFVLTAKGTKIQTLLVSKVPAGATVEVRCTGKGCPFKHKKVTVKSSKANVKPLFKHAVLRPKAVVEIRITAANRVGKVVRYTMRKGKLPTSRNLCLPVGSTKPKGC